MMYERPGRPHIFLKYNALELLAELLSLAGVLLNAFIVANRWTSLPEVVPLGGYFPAHKLWLLALGSILPIGLYVGLTVLSGRLDRFAYPVVIIPKNSAVEYRLARHLLLALKLELLWASNLALWYLTGNFANAAPTVALIVLALAAIAATIACYVWRMRRLA